MAIDETVMASTRTVMATIKTVSVSLNCHSNRQNCWDESTYNYLKGKQAHYFIFSTPF